MVQQVWGKARESAFVTSFPGGLDGRRIKEAYLDKLSYRTIEKQNATKRGMTDARYICITGRNRKNGRLIVSIMKH